MNLQQLEYIVAIEQHRHFAKAAKACYVTQPTLSMMVKRLEEELGVRLFDRSRQPVVPTEVGHLVIEQARKALREVELIPELVREQRGLLEGELRLGIIPTLAPYLLPLFIRAFIDKYPKIKLILTEKVTKEVVARLKKGELDAGILVTPLGDGALREHFLFFEEFFVYSSGGFDKQYLLPEDIDPSELWLLEEGHCFRSQILNLCALRQMANKQFEYEAGSIDTLRRLVESEQGITVLPELSTLYLNDSQQTRLRPFAPPSPVREVSLVTHRDYVKEGLIEALKAVVVGHVPPSMLERGDKLIVSM